MKLFLLSLGSLLIMGTGLTAQTINGFQPESTQSYAQTSTEQVKGLREDVSKRNAFTKHYFNKDGSMTAVISSGPVHYQLNGQFKDISNSITEVENGYSNKENLMQTLFGKTAVQAVYSTTTEGTVTEFLNPAMYWEVNGQVKNLQQAANSQSEANGNELVYKNLFGNISAKFTLLNGKKRLDYIIPDATALNNIPNNAKYLVFTEDILLPVGWSYSQTSKGIYIKDTSGKNIYLYENPTSNDAKDFGLFNNNTHFEISKNGELLTVKTKVSVEWLTDSGRDFPLTIDPNTTVYPANEDFWTVQVNSAGGGQSGLPAAGRASTGTWYRGFITFDTSSIPASEITDAKIALTTVNKAGSFDSTYSIGITQSNYDLPVWAEEFIQVYDFITNPANMAGDYVAISNPGNINTTQTYNLGTVARGDIAKKTGSINSFFSVSLRQGWSGGAAEDRYVVYADHTYGQYAPALILTYQQNDNYCHPMHLYSNCAALGDCQYIGISKVKLNTLDVGTTYDNYPIGYNRYPNDTELFKSNSYELKVTYSDQGSPVNQGKVAAWIDWSNDGQFSSDEFIGVSPALNHNQTYVFQFTVPSQAPMNTTRLRIRSVYNDESLAAGDACATKEYGETEDYSVTIAKNSMGTNELSLNQVLVYPNPATDYFQIETKSPVVAVTVYNLNGQKVLSGDNKSVNVSSLTAGNYIVKIITADGKTTSHKLMKK